MDLSAITQAVAAAIGQRADSNLEDMMLRAASALPAEASDFDRGMAAGFAAALMSKLKLQNRQGISQING